VTSIPQVPETIAEMKVIVYKARVDPTTLKGRAEEMKNELFLKRFSKPKLKDIQVVSVDKNYDPYVLVDAKYRIEYYTKKVYSIEVTEKTKEVRILGTSFKPQMAAVPGSEPEQYHKVVVVEGQEWSDFEDKVYLILDKNGNEISPDQIPIAPSEEQPKKLLNEFSKRTEIVKMSDQEVILLAKTKLIKRPEDVDIVDNESFQVNEYATIYNPVYIITFRNEKTKEEKTVRIDGVTGDVIE
jgi:hypothetical protein